MSASTDLKFGTHIKDLHISHKSEGQGHRSKVKVTKVKNVKIPVFSPASENVVQCQGYEGQGHKGQGQRLQGLQGARSKAVGQVIG